MSNAKGARMKTFKNLYSRKITASRESKQTFATERENNQWVFENNRITTWTLTAQSAAR